MDQKRNYIKPSEAQSWLACNRRVWFDNFTPEHMETISLSAFDQLIMKMGTRHEYYIKRMLEKQYQVIEATSPQHTVELMQLGVDVIYQPKLYDDVNHIVGKPDFLIRTATGEYQPADAKLAKSSEKKEIQIQLAVYRKILNSTVPALVFHSNNTISEIGRHLT